MCEKKWNPKEVFIIIWSIIENEIKFLRFFILNILLNRQHSELVIAEGENKK